MPLSQFVSVIWGFPQHGIGHPDFSIISFCRLWEWDCVVFVPFFLSEITCQPPRIAVPGGMQRSLKRGQYPWSSRAPRTNMTHFNGEMLLVDGHEEQVVLAAILGGYGRIVVSWKIWQWTVHSISNHISKRILCEYSLTSPSGRPYPNWRLWDHLLNGQLILVNSTSSTSHGEGSNDRHRRTFSLNLQW